MFEQFIKDCYDEAVNLKERFKITENKPWTALTVTNEMIVQLGHYCFIICNTDYTEEKGRNITNPKDELADILLQLCALCNKLNIKKEKILRYEVTFDNISDAILMFNVLLGQITESIMELEGYRHNKSRKGYSTKEDFIVERINKCFSIVFSISEQQNYNMINEFYKMKENAISFLKNYEEVSKNV